MSLEKLNFTWFTLLNASPDASQPAITIAIFLANILIYGVFLCIILAWVRKSEAFRFALLDAAFTVILALSLSRITGVLWYHPRPFEFGLGQKYLDHVANSSFPSDHATFLFSVAIPLLVHAISRKWGIVVFATTLPVAWARIYLGIHFPLDMIGALVLAAISTAMVIKISPLLRRRIYAPLCDFYECVIATLHLPTTLFPRG